MSRWTGIMAILVASGCASKGKDSGTDGPPLIDPDVQPFIWAMADRPELPASTSNRWADDETVAWFGRFLYFEPRLSGTGTFSCATCHDPELGTGDAKAVSEAAGVTGRHAPHIWNSAYQRWWFWDGRCDSLWCQATGPIEAPHEMDLSRMELARVISTESDLADAYTQLFGSPPDVSDSSRFPDSARPVSDDPEDPDHLAWEAMSTADQDAVTEVLVNVSKAIAAYERTLVTTDTPVDRFILALDDGDRSTAEAALTPEERHGLELFAGEGECVFCHSGWQFSNKEFHNLGLPEVPQVDFLDTGRYDGITAVREAEFNRISAWSDDPSDDAADQLDRIVQSPEQLGQFKTPGLRHVAHHAPYMHGGHFDTLADVVAFYADPTDYDGPGHREELVVARGWDDAEQAAVVAFLEALSTTDAPSADRITAPATPLP